MNRKKLIIYLSIVALITVTVRMEAQYKVLQVLITIKLLIVISLIVYR